MNIVNSSDVTALSRLFDPWRLHDLCTDWDGDLGWRHQISLGQCGIGDDGVWLLVEAGTSGVTWRDESRIPHRISWGGLRASLASIPACLVRTLGAALAAQFVANGTTLGPTSPEANEAADACWRWLCGGAA